MACENTRFQVFSIFFCFTVLSVLRIEAGHWYFSPKDWPTLDHEDAKQLLPISGNLYEEHWTYLFGHIAERNLYISLAPERNTRENFLNLIKNENGAFFCFWVAFQPVFKMKSEQHLYYVFQGVYREKDENNYLRLSVDVEGILSLTLASPRKRLEVVAKYFKLPRDSTFTFLCVKLWLSHSDSFDENNVHELYANGRKLDVTKTTKSTNYGFKTMLPSIGENSPSALPMRLSLFMFIEGIEGKGCCKPPGCVTNLCLNGGTCVPSYVSLPGFGCFCPLGFSGELCEEKLSACKSYPCKNDGTCEELEHNKFKCHCPPGIIGDKCELKQADPAKMEHRYMSELVLVPRYTHISPGDLAEFALLTKEIGQNASFEWSLKSHGDDKEIASDHHVPLPVKTDNVSILDRFPIPEDFKKSKTGFYYTILSTFIAAEGVYKMNANGLTNEKHSHTASSTITVDPSLKRMRIYMNSTVLDINESAHVATLIPSSFPQRSKIKFLGFGEEDYEMTVNFIHVPRQSPVRYQIILRFGEGIRLPSEPFFFHMQRISFKKTGTFTFEVVLPNVKDESNKPYSDHLKITTLNKIKYLELVPKSSNQFMDKPALFVCIMSEQLGTEPSFRWLVGDSVKFKAPLPNLTNCKSCILSAISQKELQALKLPEKYYVWSYIYNFPTAGNYSITVTAMNQDFPIITRVSKISVLEPMSEISLLAKDTTVHVNDLVAFVLLVPKMGDEPSFAFDFGDGLTKKIKSIIPYRPEQNDDLLANVKPADLSLFDPQSHYYILYNTFTSDGNYVLKAFGYNKDVLQREASLKVEAVYSVDGLRLLISDTLVPVGTIIYLVVVTVELGQEPVFNLICEGHEEVNITELTFSRTVKPIVNLVGLSEEDITELSKNGFFYNIQEREMHDIGEMTFRLTVYIKGKKVTKLSATAQTVEKLCKPVIRLTNVGDKLSTAVDYHRNDDISVGTETTIECTNRELGSRKWSLYTASRYNAEPDFNENNRVNLPPGVSTNGKLFHIPKATLAFGLYVVSLDIDINQEGRITSSRGHGWFRIFVSPLVPVLIGGSSRTINHMETMVIDGSQSVNPNGGNVTFTWFCESFPAEDPARLCKGMRVALPYFGPVLRFLPGRFLPDTDYNFRLQLTGEYTTEGKNFIEQSIRISQLPGINIKCSFNCQKKVNPKEKLVLEAICSVCAEAELTWEVANLDMKGVITHHNVETQPPDQHGMQSTTELPTSNPTTVRKHHGKSHKHFALRDPKEDKSVLLLQRLQSEHRNGQNHLKGTSINTRRRYYNPVTEMGGRYRRAAGGHEEEETEAPHHATEEPTPPPGSDWRVCSKFGDTGDILYLRSGCLQTGARYEVKVTLTMPGSSTAVTSSYEFIVNSPPITGACVTSPKVGEALRTRFSVHCEGFIDEDEPLTYQIFYNNDYDLASNVRNKFKGTHSGILLKKRHEPDTDQLFIPAGNPFKNYTGNITVVVSDYYGLSTEVKSTIIVRRPSRITKREIDKMVNSDLPGSIKDVLNVAGDVEGALNLANCVAEILNSESLVYVDGREKAKIRDQIIDDVSAINQRDVKLPKEVLGTIDIALRGDVNEIETETSRKALDIISTVTEDLSTTVQELSLNSNQVYETAMSAFSAASSLMRLTVATEPYNTVANTINATAEIPEKTKAKCQVSGKVFKLVDDVSSALLTKRTRAEHDLHMDTDYLSIWLRRADTLHGMESLLGHKENDAVRLPPTAALNMNDSENHELDIKMVNSPLNPYLCSESGDLVNTHTLALVIDESSKEHDKEHGKETVDVEHAPNLVEVYLKRRGEPESVASNISTESYPYFEPEGVRFHVVNVPAANVTTHILIERDNPSYTLLLAWTFACIPTIYDFQATPYVVAPGNNSYFLTFTKLENKTPEAGEYVLGILPYAKAIVDKLNRKDGHLAFDHKEEPEVLNYNFTFFVSRCLYYDQHHDIWSEKGCEVGPETSMLLIHCICSHMSAFSASFLVAPNFVDITQTLELFATAKENMVVISFMIVVWLLYFLLLIWVVRKDRRDFGKKSTVILEDNRSNENYPYVLQVFTGIRRDAGTSATVRIQLHGLRRTSRIRKLVSRKRAVFETGGEDWFLLKTEHCLGPVKAITITHDNSGDWPDWYLSQVKVLDPYAGQFWVFLVDKWISADPHKGVLSRYAQSVPRKDLQKFRIVFRQKALRELRERHAWFSVFECSPRSNFTRAQRLSCAFALFVLAMLINIMFFDVAPKEDSKDYDEQVLHLPGGWTINYIAIIIGLESSLIAYPFGFIIIQMFTLIQPEYTDEDLVADILEEAKWEVPSESVYSIAYSDMSGVSRDTDPMSSAEVQALYPDTVSLDANTEFIRNIFESHDEKGIGSGDPMTSAAMDDADTMVKVLFDPSDNLNSWPLKVNVLPPEDGMPGGLPVEHNGTKDTPKDQPKELHLPWWFIYIAWGITLAATLLNTFFIMLYGLTYGYAKSVDWVESNVMAFAESNVLLDPLQVLIVLIVSTYFMGVFRGGQTLTPHE